jgi:Nitronate monooxygenase
MSASRPVFHTRLRDVLSIDGPILQPCMGGVAGPALAAEVSNAGGLGILAAALLPTDQFRQGTVRAEPSQTGLLGSTSYSPMICGSRRLRRQFRRRPSRLCRP